MNQAVLDAPPETAAAAEGPAQAPRAQWCCPECGHAFDRRQPGQLFCSKEHKRTYNNRWLKRGAVLAPLYAAARATRGGTRGDKATGAKARRDADFLVQRWREEDAAANRASAVDYVAARYRLGLVEVM